MLVDLSSPPAHAAANAKHCTSAPHHKPSTSCTLHLRTSHAYAPHAVPLPALHQWLRRVAQRQLRTSVCAFMQPRLKNPRGCNCPWQPRIRIPLLPLAPPNTRVFAPPNAGARGSSAHPPCISVTHLAHLRMCWDRSRRRGGSRRQHCGKAGKGRRRRARLLEPCPRMHSSPCPPRWVCGLAWAWAWAWACVQVWAGGWVWWAPDVW